RIAFMEGLLRRKRTSAQSADVSLHDMLEVPAQAVLRRTLRLSCDAVQPGAVPDYPTPLGELCRLAFGSKRAHGRLGQADEVIVGHADGVSVCAGVENDFFVGGEGLVDKNA